MNTKTKIDLLNIKIKLLEDFIFESNRLAELYNWRVPNNELVEIERLSTELDKITKILDVIPKNKTSENKIK